MTLSKKDGATDKELMIGRLLSMKDRPYLPSWTDRLNGWVEGLPIPGFLFYLMFYVVITFIPIILGWIEAGQGIGPVPWGDFIYQIFTFEAFYFNYWLYGVASSSLREFSRDRNLSTSVLQGLEYRFTILPARWINWLTYAVIILSIGLAFISPVLFNDRDSSSFIGFLHSYSDWVFSLMGAAIFLYRLVHQTRAINTIYSQISHVDLFDLGPIYALSSFMSKAGLIFLLIVYSNLFLDPSNLKISGFVIGSLIISAIVLAGFVLPLLGINRKLVLAKNQLLKDSNTQIKRTFDLLNREQESKGLGNISNVRQLTDAVIRKNEFIRQSQPGPGNLERSATYYSVFSCQS